MTIEYPLNVMDNIVGKIRYDVSICFNHVTIMTSSISNFYIPPRLLVLTNRSALV